MPLPRVLADLPVSPVVVELLAGHVELVPWDSAAPIGAVVKPGFAGDRSRAPIDAIYTYGHPIVDTAMMDRFAGLKVISNFGVGVDHIDVLAASERGIPVGNTPGILDGATADLAFALILTAGRRVVEGDRYARSPAFTRFDPSFMLGREVHSSTLGIFGMGRIGRQIALRANGFGMKVLYHNRTRSDEAEVALKARYASKEELLASADYIVLTLPLAQETRGFIGRAEFAKMKPTAVLINVARGAVVDQDALTEALTVKRIFAAALDVTDPEPLPRDHPLLKLENVIITPHLGSATEETRRRMAEMSVENLLAGLEGRVLANRVN